MRCNSVRKLLIPFLSGEVSPSTGAAIEQHLSRCRECAAERDLLVESWDMLGDYNPPEVRDDFTSSLMGRIRSEEAGARRDKIVSIRPARASGRWRFVAAAAACLVVALTVGLLWHRPRRPSGPGGIAVVSVTDEQIIRDLDVYENAEMLDDLDLFADLDVLEDMDDASLPSTGGA